MNNYVGRPGPTQVLATSTTAASATALTFNTKVVRLVATVPTFVSFNGPATLTSGVYLPAGVPEYFFIQGETSLSAILASGTGSLYITECSH